MNRFFLAPFFAFLLVTNAISGQDKEYETLSTQEDTLYQLRSEVLKAENDTQRISANLRFFQQLEQTLSRPESFNHPFGSLETIAVLSSSDKKIRIINWNLPFDNGTHRYFGFVQIAPEKKEAYRCYPLTDNSNSMHSPDNKTTNHKNWYGSLYYEIIPVKHKRKTYYVLLGWDGNDPLTTKKIIEVLTVTSKGINFGDAVFKKWEEGPVKRIIFEYSSQAMMSLRYNPKKKQIIFDHLSPKEPVYEKQKQYYGPDLSFDALQLKKGKWIYTPDVDARMDKE